jgi:hypothetical protein
MRSVMPGVDAALHKKKALRGNVFFFGVQGQENQKLMSTPGIKDRIGNVGNQVRSPKQKT